MFFLCVTQFRRSEVHHRNRKRSRTMSRIPVSSLVDSEDESVDKIPAQESTTQNRRIRWTPEEDEDLKKLVETHGEGTWDALATMMTTQRTGRQLRARWKNKLDPRLERRQWTAEEDRLLLRGKDEAGLSWSALTHQFHGRCDNDLKNRYFQLTRTRRGKRTRSPPAERTNKASKGASSAGPSGPPQSKHR